MEEGGAEAKLQRFLQWLQVNGAELQGCEIRYCGPKIGYGIFSANNSKDGILLVVPLDLAVTPMRVLQDPILGPKCRAMLDEGDVDDRFLMILFLTLERLRKDSSWKPYVLNLCHGLLLASDDFFVDDNLGSNDKHNPRKEVRVVEVWHATGVATHLVSEQIVFMMYLDMLPTTFGNPLWFTDDELLELKGTTLYRATEMQKKSLQAMFEDKVKHLVKELLPLEGESERYFNKFSSANIGQVCYFPREVCFEDFLWANSIFWTRALNIPFPHTYIFPQVPRRQEAGCLPLNKDDGAALAQIAGEMPRHGEPAKGSHSCRKEREVPENLSSSPQLETVWVEGLVPGIDFCNHDLRAAATWEIDGTGSTTGTPSSMYLLAAEENAFKFEKEICISYGNKGNEELLYLYGFVIDENPDDYLMVHYPIEAFNRVPFSDSKAELLDIQKAEMRCLLPRRLLEHGFFSASPLQEERNTNLNQRSCNYSWSGQRKVPSYLSKLVFPEDFLAALRTIAMQESELLQVLSLLEELVGPGEERQPSDTEVRAAVWEACGDSGALQLLVDLLSVNLDRGQLCFVRMIELEEGTGGEASDTELLEKALVSETLENVSKNAGHQVGEKVPISKNRWSSIVYRRGQKQLTSKFLKEAERALQLCLSEQ